MMHFKLPKPGTKPEKYNLEIHIPCVSDPPASAGAPDYSHVYKAGGLPPKNPTVNDLMQTQDPYTLNIKNFNPIHPGTLPLGIYTTSNVMLAPDLAQGDSCGCVLPEPNPNRWCKIVMPMPDEYEGYVRGYVKSGYLLGSGKTTTNCKNPLPSYKYPYPLATLTAIPLVHVFRYWNYDSVTLDKPDGKPLWPGGTKLAIFAEPAVEMAPGAMSNKHLQRLDALFTAPADLTFADPTQLAADSPVGDGVLIYTSDLYSLSSYAHRGGNPADCISGWGS
jgi:hypothetical protein